MPIKKVTHIGADGDVGSKILDALRAEPSFVVSVLRRKSSKSTSSPGKDVNGRDIDLLIVPDDLAIDPLVEILRGQDAVVASFALKDVGAHLRLVEASARAGVKRYIPSDYGSCDADTARAQELLKLYRDRVQVSRRTEELAGEHEGFTWTTLTCGHFFDWGLKEKFLHFDIPERKVDLLDGGNHKASYSTLPRVAEAVVQILLREVETKNKKLYVQSFCITQREVLAAAEQATDSKWTVKEVESTEFMEEQKRLMEKGNKQAIEELVWALGTVEGDWTARDGFAMKLLGLEDENLDAVVARVVDEG